MRPLFAVTLSISVVGIAASGCSRKDDASAPSASASAATLAAPSSAASGSPAAAGPAVAKGPLSCDQRKVEYFEDTCIEFTGDSLKKGEDTLKRSCVGGSNGKAVFAASVCPTDGVVLSCSADKGGSIWRYYGGGTQKYTADTAKKRCDVIDGKVL